MEEPIKTRNVAEAASTAKRRESYQWRSKAEEYEIISDLTGFDNLRAMTEGEASVQRRKRRRRKRKKNKHAHPPLPVDAGKPAIDTEQAARDEARKTVEVSKMDFIEISDNDVTQNLAVDTSVKESKVEFIDLLSSSSEDDNLISNISSQICTREMVSVEATINKDNETVRRYELKTVVAEATVDAGKSAENAKCVETVKSPETKSTQKTVIRKLLRKPRYFDSPNGVWARCFSYRDHPAAAANCTLQQRVKPCFLCGSLQHNGKHCIQGISQHANGCAKKQEENNLASIICLRCGDSGHDMFSCRSDYSPDDLKKIQCYVCSGFGHLCCVNLLETNPTEVSCYNCGQSGHLGSECTKFPESC